MSLPPATTDLMQVVDSDSLPHAAREAKSIIDRWGRTGYVWLRDDGRVRVAVEDNGLAPRESYVGKYRPESAVGLVRQDMELAQKYMSNMHVCPKCGGPMATAFSKTCRKCYEKHKHAPMVNAHRTTVTRETVTESMTVETAELSHVDTNPPILAADPILVEQPAAAVVVAPVVESLSAPVASPAPTLFHDTHITKLEAEIQRLQSEIAVARLLRILVSVDDRNSLVSILTDYLEMLRTGGVTEDELEDLSWAAEARRFAAIFSAPWPARGKSLLDAVAKRLRFDAAMQLSCAAGDNSDNGNAARNDAAVSALGAALLDGQDIAAEDCQP